MNPIALVTPGGEIRSVPQPPGPHPLWVTMAAGTDEGFFIVGWDCPPIAEEEAGDTSGCGEGTMRVLSYRTDAGWKEIDHAPDELGTAVSAISNEDSVISFPTGLGLVRYDEASDRWSVDPLAMSGQLGGCASRAGLLTVGFHPAVQGLEEQDLTVEREDGRSVAVGEVTSPRIICASRGEGMALVASVGPSAYIAADDLAVTALPSLADTTGDQINDLAVGGSLVNERLRVVTYTPANALPMDPGTAATINVSDPTNWSIAPVTAAWAATDVEAESMETNRTVAVIAIRMAGTTEGQIDHFEVVITDG